MADDFCNTYQARKLSRDGKIIYRDYCLSDLASQPVRSFLARSPVIGPQPALGPDVSWLVEARIYPASSQPPGLLVAILTRGSQAEQKKPGGAKDGGESVIVFDRCSAVNP